MTILQFIFIFLTVVALSLGQILFKLAAQNIELSISGIIDSLLSAKLFSALCVYGLATLMWLLVLRAMPLRVAYPFAALAFIVVPVLSHLLLGERLGWNTFAGAALIGAGVWLSIYQ